MYEKAGVCSKWRAQWTNRLTIVLREVQSEVVVRVGDLCPEYVHFVQEKDLHKRTGQSVQVNAGCNKLPQELSAQQFVSTHCAEGGGEGAYHGGLDKELVIADSLEEV